jgi:hypothetical protein
VSQAATAIGQLAVGFAIRANAIWHKQQTIFFTAY